MLTDLATILERRLDDEMPNHDQSAKTCGGWVIVDQAQGDAIETLQASCLFRSDANEMCCTGKQLPMDRP